MPPSRSHLRTKRTDARLSARATSITIVIESSSLWTSNGLPGFPTVPSVAKTPPLFYTIRMELTGPLRLQETPFTGARVAAPYSGRRSGRR